MNKKKLLDLIKKKEERKTAIVTEADKCEDVAQLRKLNSELDTLNGEIRSLQEMADAITDEEPAKSAEPTSTRSIDPDGRTAAVNGEVPGIVAKNARSEVEKAKTAENRGNKFASAEYRQAFMTYVQRGTPVPAEYRSDAFTSTTDAAAVIPTTIVNEVIRTLKQYGNLYARVRKLNIRGGVKVPISSVAPTATWITESTVSDRKKVDMSGSVTFSYYGLECKIAASLLAEETTLDIFESTVIELITEAMMKALDAGIISGDGSGEMTGITAVASGVTSVTLSTADFVDWSAWKKKVFSKLGIRYKAGAVFMMANGTFEGYIDGMTDANGQPIGRMNYGITDGSQERFGGKEVMLVEDDIIANYDDASTGDVVAVFGDLNKYAINTNMSMTMYRYLDHDTNQWIDKAILIADGKVLDANAFVIVKKGA